MKKGLDYVLTNVGGLGCNRDCKDKDFFIIVWMRPEAIACNGLYMARIPKGMGYMRCCVSGVVLKNLLSVYHRHFFFSFLSVRKNILKKYLQKFVDVHYLRIFVE